MKSGKCNCKCMCLCPVSFGLAMAITYALTILLAYAAVMMFGNPAEMEAIKNVTGTMVLVRILWGLLEGFVFGAVFALLYDFFACCIMRKCKKSGESCGCEDVSAGDKPDK